MADSRIKDLDGDVSSGQLPALLNTLFLAVDDTSFSEAEQILLKTILTEAIVTSNSNNYQALTPKAFYDSIMTTARKGIGQLSSDANVTSKSGTGLLNSLHQVLMQAQWKIDWFQAAGVPNIFSADTLVNPQAISFNANWEGALAQFARKILSPDIGTSTILAATYQYVITAEGGNKASSKFQYLKYVGVEVTSDVDTGNLFVYISSDGKTFGLYCGGVLGTNIRCSMTVNMVLN